MIYAGNGIAYAKVLDEDYTNEWNKVWTDNIFWLAKVDLYGQTVTKMNIPKCQIMSLDNGIVESGTLYLPISEAGEGTSIYAIDIDGGASDFVKGATLEGDNVFVHSIFRNNRESL
ncbi:MAG: hypothetical protein AAF944_11455 [Bacteroidota bacterium]